MRRKLFNGAIVLTVLSLLAGCRGRTEAMLPLREPFSSVNPFIGTGGIGYGVGAQLPGALVPFGMVKLSPDTSIGGGHIVFDHNSGYYYHDTDIRGFSHTHFVGTGGGDDYGNIRVMPIVADGGIGDDRIVESGYRSGFRHETEEASPGYYAVTLDRHDIRAELTATEHAGCHRYTFPKTDWAYVLIDVSEANEDNTSKDSWVEVLPETREVIGWVDYQGGMPGRFKLYFSAKFQKSFDSSGVWSDGAIVGGTFTTAVRTGAFVRFKVAESEPVELAVGISYISVEQAQLNRDTEVSSLDFDGVRGKAEEAWREALGKIEVEGGTDEEAEIFYTAMYHLGMMPTLFSEVGGVYMGFDGKVHIAEGFRFYSDQSLWDTFRTYHPLMILLDPERQRDFVKSLIAMAEQIGYVPRWPAAQNESGSMIGTPADIVIAETYLKGIRGFDVEKAYQHLTQSAYSPYNRRKGFSDYVSLGYVPGDVSNTVEPAHEDWALANLAHELGKDEDEAIFRARSLNYKNLWDPSVRYLRARESDGSWVAPFNPADWSEPYCEGDAIQWTWYAPQDPQGLIELFGGAGPFLERLEEFFGKSTLVGNESAEISNFDPDTFYWHGNEPDIHAAYLFNEAGRPDRTQYWARKIMEKKYTTGPEGIAGNDDGGTLSAWYIFSALGFYPIAGGDRYWVGSPIFRRAVVHMEGGDLVVRIHGVSPGVRYIRSVTLNGKPLTQPWFYHSEIARGGSLDFVMSDQPSSWGTGR